MCPTFMRRLTSLRDMPSKSKTSKPEVTIRKVTGTCLNVGDRVLLSNKGKGGKKKLADKWEPTVYTVVDSNPQTHIYRLEDNGKTKVVHRNLILTLSVSCL